MNNGCGVDDGNNMLVTARGMMMEMMNTMETMRMMEMMEMMGVAETTMVMIVSTMTMGVNVKMES